jgi:glutathione S-transferase
VLQVQESPRPCDTPGTPMTSVLYAMPYSPWSERARFALLHHRLPFEEREHTPVLGELGLRLRARKLSGRVTVPLFVHDGQTIMDSIAIAEHADRIGSGRRLIPEPLRKLIHALNARIEPMFEAARARAIETTLSDDEAARDLAPPRLRNLPLAISASRLGARFIRWKHPTPSTAITESLRAGLQEIRSALGKRSYVHGTFSYADIIAVTAIQCIAPASERYIPLNPIQRRTWTHQTLTTEFPDLIQWRDTLYQKHRPTAS